MAGVHACYMKGSIAASHVNSEQIKDVLAIFSEMGVIRVMALGILA